MATCQTQYNSIISKILCEIELIPKVRHKKSNFWDRYRSVTGDFLVWHPDCPGCRGGMWMADGVSSDEAGASRRWCCAGEFTSGERMLAGGGCVVGGRTPAKPRWSEVMIFLAVFLRQRSPLQEENASSDKEALVGGDDLFGMFSSGGNPFTGGTAVFQTHPPAESPLTGAGPSGKGSAVISPYYL